MSFSRKCISSRRLGLPSLLKNELGESCGANLLIKGVTPAVRREGGGRVLRRKLLLKGVIPSSAEQG